MQTEGLMNMPLSREVCERLASAFPEVRDHEWRVGDYYYLRDEPTRLPGVLVSVAVHDDGIGYELRDQVGDVPDLQGRDPGNMVWCPRLDQLMGLLDSFIGGISTRHLGSICGYIMPYTVPFSLMAGEGIFVVTAAVGGHQRRSASGPTPETAIAHWLLDGREEAKNRADPPQRG